MLAVAVEVHTRNLATVVTVELAVAVVHQSQD
jgi:hypothetical protein